MLARNPWFCMSMADFTPAKCAPAEMPTPSSSLARRTRIICGSSSAMRIRCTSHVSGSADTSPIPHFFSALYTTSELVRETGIRKGSSLQEEETFAKSQMPVQPESKDYRDLIRTEDTQPAAVERTQ